jgi:hypothetical protein
MKLTLIVTALAALLGFTCVPAHGQATAPAPAVATKAPDTTKKTPYKGSITAITATSVTIQGAKGPMTLAIAPTTKYKGGKSTTDFAVGDVVTGSYTTDASGATTAYSLHKKKAK